MLCCFSLFSKNGNQPFSPILNIELSEFPPGANTKSVVRSMNGLKVSFLGIKASIKRRVEMESLIHFLDELEERKIYYRLNKIRDSILVEIAVPGERWEVEFFANGEIEVEKFLSNGEILGKSELKTLSEKFSD